MNTLQDLNRFIEDAWKKLGSATAEKNWGATQNAFRDLTKLQSLHDQSQQLLEQIAGWPDGANPNGGSPIDLKAHPASTDARFNTRRRTTRPRKLKIGTDHVPISINNQIVIETAHWILKQGKSLPVIPNFVQRTNSGFARSAITRRLVDGSFIEIGDSQDVLLQKARKLLNISGFRNLELEVLLEDGSLKAA